MLNISALCLEADVRSAYRTATLTCHPDRLAGMPPLSQTPSHADDAIDLLQPDSYADQPPRISCDVDALCGDCVPPLKRLVCVLTEGLSLT